jgi:HlyD family secretion protein
MPAISQLRVGLVGKMFTGGAFALGLVGLYSIRAQERGDAGQNSPQAAVLKPGTLARQPGADTIRARWRAQQIAARKAECEYHKARIACEIAEISALDYEETNLSQDLAAVDGEIRLAESDVRRSEDRVDWARRMFAKGYVSLAGKNADELGLQRAQFALEQAQTRKKLMTDYTQPRRVMELKSEVEKARSNELVQKAIWEREKAREADLQRQAGQSQSTNTKPASR